MLQSLKLSTTAQAKRPLIALQSLPKSAPAALFSSYSTKQSPDNRKFNIELNQKDYDLNKSKLEEFEDSKDGSKDVIHHKELIKEHVNTAKGEYSSLEEKGQRIPEEQDRPDDFM